MGKTIGRNQRKKAEQIFTNAQNIRVYTLENGFSGKSANREGYDGKNWLLKEWNTFNFARLSKTGWTTDGLNKYCLYIHSNCWYDFIA